MSRRGASDRHIRTCGPGASQASGYARQRPSRAGRSRAGEFHPAPRPRAIRPRKRGRTAASPRQKAPGGPQLAHRGLFKQGSGRGYSCGRNVPAASGVRPVEAPMPEAAGPPIRGAAAPGKAGGEALAPRGPLCPAPGPGSSRPPPERARPLATPRARHRSHGLHTVVEDAAALVSRDGLSWRSVFCSPNP